VVGAGDEREALILMPGQIITFALEDELVSISMTSDGKLIIHQFRRVDDTRLGQEVIKILLSAHLPLAKK
jgi:hypothetical protein